MPSGRGARLVFAGIQPDGFLLFKDAFLVGVPAIAELPLVLVGPGLGDVMGTMNGTRRPPHQKGAIRFHGTMPAHPFNRLVGHVLREVVVFVVGYVRRRNGVIVLPQRGFPLGCFTRDKAIEIVKAAARGSPIVGAVGNLIDRRVVVFAKRCSRVAVVAKHFGDGRR